MFGPARAICNGGHLSGNQPQRPIIVMRENWMEEVEMEQRYRTFDYLRGLSILAVVLIHLTVPTAIAEETGGIILNQITRFGVPVFIFLSGWGLTVAESYERSASYFVFLKKRLSKLLPAYLVWNIIYVLYDVIFEDLDFTISVFIEGIFYGTNYPHLYFVPLIVLFYLAFPILRKMGETHWGLCVSFMITIGSLEFYPVLMEGFTENQNPLNWLFYFVFGIWIAEHGEFIQKQLNPYWVTILLSVSLIYVLLEPIALADGLTLEQTRPSVLFYSVFFILSTITAPNWLKPIHRLLTPLSDYSFEIYLSHYLFIRVYRLIWADIPVIILLVLVITSSIVLDQVKQKLIKVTP